MTTLTVHTIVDATASSPRRPQRRSFDEIGLRLLHIRPALDAVTEEATPRLDDFYPHLEALVVAHEAVVLPGCYLINEPAPDVLS